MAQGTTNTNDVLLSVVTSDGVTEELYPKTKASLVNIDTSKNSFLNAKDLQTFLNDIKSGAYVEASEDTAPLNNTAYQNSKKLATQGEVSNTGSYVMNIISQFTQGFHLPGSNQMKLATILADAAAIFAPDGTVTGWKSLGTAASKTAASSVNNITNEYGTLQDEKLASASYVPTLAGISSYLKYLANPKKGTNVWSSSLTNDYKQASYFLTSANKYYVGPMIADGKLSLSSSSTMQYRIIITFIGIPIYVADIEMPSTIKSKIGIQEYFKLGEHAPYDLTHLYNCVDYGDQLEFSNGKLINLWKLILFRTPGGTSYFDDTSIPGMLTGKNTGSDANLLYTFSYYNSLHVDIYEI